MSRQNVIRMWAGTVGTSISVISAMFLASLIVAGVLGGGLLGASLGQLITGPALPLPIAQAAVQTDRDDRPVVTGPALTLPAPARRTSPAQNAANRPRPAVLRRPDRPARPTSSPTKSTSVRRPPAATVGVNPEPVAPSAGRPAPSRPSQLGVVTEQTVTGTTEKVKETVQSVQQAPQVAPIVKPVQPVVDPAIKTVTDTLDGLGRGVATTTDALKLP